VYRELRSFRSACKSCGVFLAEYFILQDMIHKWKNSLNLPLGMSSIPAEVDSELSESTVLLQFGYHQTLVATHPGIFLHLPLFNSSAVRDQVLQRSIIALSQVET
jgi:hypothetical protein